MTTTSQESNWKPRGLDYVHSVSGERISKHQGGRLQEQWMLFTPAGRVFNLGNKNIFAVAARIMSKGVR